MGPTNVKTVHQTSLLNIEKNLDRLGLLSPTYDQRSQQQSRQITLQLVLINKPSFSRSHTDNVLTQTFRRFFPLTRWILRRFRCVQIVLSATKVPWEDHGNTTNPALNQEFHVFCEPEHSTYMQLLNKISYLFYCGLNS